ncbi:hypothetical protein LUZ60_009080 [Juncus effusus]|nr:hypothetical protein LUZ60_009080 [Juncus effusus]
MASHKGVVLLGHLFSPFDQRVRITLKEKGIEYEYKEEENLFKQKSELLLEMNKVHKKVPVLIHEGKPVCESLIIVQYIEETWPDKTPLLSSDPYQRAQARFWADFLDNKMYDCGTRIWKLKGEAQETAKKEMIEILQLLEMELGDKKYFGGVTFGYFDITFIPLTIWFYTYETFGNFKIREMIPKINEWAKRCMERESVRESLVEPEMLYNDICFLRKEIYGIE